MKQGGSPNNSGFTLIELLVVISIIGFLASIIMVSMNNARAKSRNAKRTGDIKQIHTALNLALTDNALPPSGWACISSTCYGSWNVFSANPSVDAYLAGYIPAKPADPAGGKPYGGYLFINPAGQFTGYDGTVYPPGSYLDWVVEGPLNENSCGPGKAYSQSAAVVECVLGIN